MITNRRRDDGCGHCELCGRHLFFGEIDFSTSMEDDFIEHSIVFLCDGCQKLTDTVREMAIKKVQNDERLEAAWSNFRKSNGLN